jgi:hypothetical protein
MENWILWPWEALSNTKTKFEKFLRGQLPYSYMQDPTLLGTLFNSLLVQNRHPLPIVGPVVTPTSPQ